MSDYTGKKPTSADRVSDRLIEATDRIAALESALIHAQHERDDYAESLAALQDKLEHTEAQRDTARSERAIYQNKLRRIHHDTMGA